MALNLNADIEIQSVWTTVGFLKKKKTVQVELCLLGEKLCTKVQKTPLPLIFNEKLSFKKEFNKMTSFSTLSEMINSCQVVMSLVEINLTENCQQKRKCIFSGKLPLSSFLFPPSHISKFQSTKLFPHKTYKPVLKFWVDAILFRSSAQCLSNQVPDLKNQKLIEEMRKTYALEDKGGLSDSDSCCFKCFGGIQQLPMKRKMKSCCASRKTSGSSCDIIGVDDYKPQCDDDNMCGDDMMSVCTCLRSFDSDDKCCGGGGAGCKECGDLNPPRTTRKSLKDKVDFWLHQLYLMSCKPADEFSNLMRSIYNKQYSQALLRYNQYCMENKLPTKPDC